MKHDGMPVLLATVAVAVGLATVAAHAQTDPMAMARRSAANQLGVLEYCQDQGDVGPNAVAAQKEAINHLPASSAAADDAESTGKGGSLTLPDGSTRSLSSMASQTNVTVAALCSKLGNSAVSSAAMYKNNGMPGGTQMPAMPGGMQMPAMPNGMQMPSAPGMPAAPPSPPS